MADCGEIGVRLGEALQQKSRLPANIPEYCLDVAGDDPFDVNLYKACIRSQHQLRMDLDIQIADLEHSQALCDRLIGNWAISAPVTQFQGGVTIDFSGQLTISTWDTDGPFGGSLALSSGQPTESLVCTFREGAQPQLLLEVRSPAFTLPEGNVALYVGSFVSLQPVSLAGHIEGILTETDGPFAPWTAQRL